MWGLYRTGGFSGERFVRLAGLHFKEWFNGMHVSAKAIEFYRKE